jgi:hypothetical protein
LVDPAQLRNSALKLKVEVRQTVVTVLLDSTVLKAQLSLKSVLRDSTVPLESLLVLPAQLELSEQLKVLPPKNNARPVTVVATVKLKASLL